MISKVVRYKIKASEERVVVKALYEFVDAVSAHEPDTHYEIFQLEDGVSFIHTLRFKDAAAEQNHQNAGYTSRFVTLLYPACETPPEYTTVKDTISTELPK
jgi:quinol monooxygenase YgiN